MIFVESQSYKPFHYAWAIEAAKKQAIDMFWDVHQIELQDDLRQYNSRDGLATPNFTHAQNKRTIDIIQPLFTQLDKTVADGYVKLLPFTKNNEIKTLLITHAQKETVHQRAYALLAESFGFVDSDWILFNDYKEMRDKIEVMSNFDDLDLSTPLGYAKALTVILLGEGIGLFGAFTVLLNYKRFALLMGFNDVNSWSLGDETGHVENNIRIVKNIVSKLSYAEQIELQAYTEALVTQFVQAEANFIDLVGAQEDLTKDQLCLYMEYLGVLRLFQLGYRTFKEVPENPLPWMEWMLSGEKHDSFFEKRVTSYSHGGRSGEINFDKYLTLLE